MTPRTVRRYTRIGALLGLLAAFVFIAATDAQAHHAKASATGTYWKCTSNGVKSHGTTRVHIHHVKPSKRHMRRHRCVKRTRKAPVIAAPKVQAEAQVQVVEKIVYVPTPAEPCQPCEPPENPCERECGEDTHSHQHGNGHQKCSPGKGHYKDRDD